MPKYTQAELDVVRQASSDSLKYLATSMLGYKDWDVVHDDLERFLRRPARKKALLLPRGHLKSSLVTMSYSILKILKNPNVRILIANQVWDMSRTFLREIKQQLETSPLKYLFGEFVSDKWNEDEIIVRQRTKPLASPTITTTGVDAEKTGSHYDVIILDDLTGLQNSQTPEQREKTKRFRRSMINLLDPGGELIEIGTRWHLDDTFSLILDEGSTERKYYDVMVKRIVEDGKIIFPRHFSKKFNTIRKEWEAADAGNCMDYIDHLKASMPIDEFMAQYYNDPISSENQVFRKDYFQYWEKRPEGIYIGMAVDLAISQKTDADFTAITVLGMDKDWNVYILDYLRGKWTPTEILNNIFEMQYRWKPYQVGMEVNGFQRTIKLALEDEMRRRKQYFGVDEIKTGPDTHKQNRIKSLEPFYRQHKVFHAQWMRSKEMEIELLTFPKGKHDDIIDAMCMALPMLSPGSVQTHFTVPPGSWEHEFQMVQRLNRPKARYWGAYG